MRIVQITTPIFVVFSSGVIMPSAGLDQLGFKPRMAHAQSAAEQKKTIEPIVRKTGKGRPAKLQIKIPKAGAPRFARVLGVPQDFRLSHGFSLGGDSNIWYVAASDFATLELIPPEGFVGASQLYVDYFSQSGTSDKPVYTRSEWYVVEIGTEAKSSAPNATASTPEALPTSQPERPPQPYEQEAVAILRAQELLGRGDITGARLLYEDQAVSGSAAGAFALAKTYDPQFLRSLGVIGMQPDLELARKWYRKAKELGNNEASQRLSELQ